MDGQDRVGSSGGIDALIDSMIHQPSTGLKRPMIGIQHGGKDHLDWDQDGLHRNQDHLDRDRDQVGSHLALDYTSKDINQDRFPSESASAEIESGSG